VARHQRVVTIREVRRGRPGRVLVATTDPAVVTAVEQVLLRRLSNPQDANAPGQGGASQEIPDVGPIGNRRPV
jgi:hypothetical protein